MRTTEYIYDKAFIKGRTEEMRARLQQREPGRRLEDKAAEVLYQRLSESPERYLEFGPYWWAVKSALRTMGREIGPDNDPAIFETYCIRRDNGTLDIAGCFVAGEEFREMYQGTWFRGSRTFDLGGDVRSYTLADEDMDLVPVTR